MRCAACGSENAETARFCGSCGEGLTGSCPQCGERLVAGNRFCNACGARVDGPVAPEGLPVPDTGAERRRVSVLFVDLEDFTGLAEAHDPEEVRAVQSRYFEVARSLVAAYGGTIEKFIGDAVMAMWGAPVAHEDDADRAVRAALAVVDAVGRMSIVSWKQSLAARAAVTTGEAAVSVGAIGQGMVTGDLVATAARLQAEAPPGGVLIDETTRERAADAADYEPTGTLDLKGRSAPVVAFRAMARVRAWPGRQRGGHTGEFVGRERELRELVELFDAVSRDRRSRLVSISGIAGIGKSRLAWELGEQLEGRPDAVAWHVGRAPAYGDEITFEAVAEMVRHRIRLRDVADPELVRRHLADALRELVPDDADRRWIEPRLGVLLGRHGLAEFERDELFAAWRRFFERVSDAAPAVLVFEDLQWADPGLLDFVEHLASWSRDHPILIVALARPELLERRPAWGASVASYTAVRLERLDDAAMRRLLAGRAPGVDEALAGRILERAGGVPLYAVEMARSLADRAGGAEGPPPGGERRAVPRSDDELAAIEVPESLHGVIAARIDALPAADRRLLLAAAVLGRRFRTDALAAVASAEPAVIRERVDGLARRELLEIDDAPASTGHGEVAFVQDLVREVAYGTLGRTERRGLHLAAARFLEARTEDEAAEALAQHLLAAHRLAPTHPDAPRLARRAVGALRRAAQTGLRLHAAGRAVGHLEHALRLVDEAQLRTVVLDEAANAARAAAQLDLAEQHLRELAQLHRDAGRRREAAITRAQLASVLLLAQHNERAITELEVALRATRPTQADPAYLELVAQLARARMLVGDDRAGLEWAERGLAAAERLRLEPLGLDLLVTRGTARVHLGDDEGGIGDLRQAIADARKASALHVELRARNNLAWLTVSDDPRTAMDAVREAVELATEMGVGDLAVQLGTVACAVAIETGDWSWSLATAAELERQPIAIAHRIDLAATSAIIHALRGDPSPLERLDSLATTATDLDPQLAAAMDRARSWAAFTAGDFDQAHRLSRGASAASFGVDRLQHLSMAARAALWAERRADAAEALEALSELKVGGHATAAAVATARAGLAALDGDEAAGALYRAAADDWSALGLPFRSALCELDADRMSAGGRRDEAVATLEGLEARGLLALIAGTPARVGAQLRRSTERTSPERSPRGSTIGGEA